MDVDPCFFHAETCEKIAQTLEAKQDTKNDTKLSE